MTDLERAARVLDNVLGPVMARPERMEQARLGRRTLVNTLARHAIIALLPPSDAMVEAAARAAYEAVPHDVGTWTTTEGWNRDLWRRAARAALEAGLRAVGDEK
jgi:hypothetical protein